MDAIDTGPLDPAAVMHVDEGGIDVGRIISAEPGACFANQSQRDLLALTESGTLYISESHRADHHVLSYLDMVETAGLAYTVELTTPERIKQMYSDASESHALDSTAQQEQVVSMLRESQRLGASDIHIINRHDSSLVRQRIDGILLDYKRLRPKEGMALASTIYQSMLDVSGDTHFNENKSQDGRLKQEFVSSIGLYGARVGTRPMERGHLTVMRLLHNTMDNPSLGDLGYLPEQVEMIERMCHNKTGINILSGATGSGKSLSLKCVLERQNEIFEEAINILTLEDPPEYKIKGAVQTPVLNQDWPGSIKNAVRLDPDVILIGEMRDMESATAGFRAAMTGHGVCLAGPGCDHCRGGHKGRTLVAEVMVPDLAFMQEFRAHGKVAARAYWREQMRGITKSDHIVRRVNEGLVDPLAAERDVGFTLDWEVRTK